MDSESILVPPCVFELALGAGTTYRFVFARFLNFRVLTWTEYTVRLGGGGQCLRRWRGGDGAAPGGQGIRARCREHDAVPLLGQAGAGGRHGRGDRSNPAGLALGSAVRRRRGTPPLRLGLSGTGRSRCAKLLRLSLRVDHVDTRPADPARPERRENGLLHDLVSKGNADGGAG